MWSDNVDPESYPGGTATYHIAAIKFQFNNDQDSSFIDLTVFS